MNKLTHRESVILCTAQHNTVVGELERILGSVELLSVSKLQISGCSSLEMPSAIAQLSQLSQLHIRDSIIQQWNAGAAIVHASKPELTDISVSNTPLTPFPIGLCCTGGLPDKLSKVQFNRANLSSLPGKLETLWAYLSTWTATTSLKSLMPSCG